MEAEDAPAPPTYQSFLTRLKSREGVDFDCPNPQLEGFNDLTLEQKHCVVDAVSFILSFSAVLQAIVSTEPHEGFAPFVETARTFLPWQTQASLRPNQTPIVPFQALVRRTNNSDAEYAALVA